MSNRSSARHRDSIARTLIGGTPLLGMLLLGAACKMTGNDDTVPVVPGPTPTPSPTASPSPTPTPTPSPTATPIPGQVVATFNFNQNTSPWSSVFADYPANNASIFNFEAGYAAVPAGLVGTGGFKLASDNRSDDVFMGVFLPYGGLRASTRYRVEATISIASNAGTGCVGIGGAPGESVYVKAGASGVAPTPTTTGQVTLPIDKGNQAQGGRDLVVIGNVAIPANTRCSDADPFVRKTLTTGGNGPIVTSDASGRVWLIAGTDSGYEGRTTIYVLDGSFTLTPA